MMELATDIRKATSEIQADADFDARQGFDLGVAEKNTAVFYLGILADALEGSDLWTAEDVARAFEEAEVNSAITDEVRSLVSQAKEAL